VRHGGTACAQSGTARTRRPGHWGGRATVARRGDRCGETEPAREEHEAQEARGELDAGEGRAAQASGRDVALAGAGAAARAWGVSAGAGSRYDGGASHSPEREP